MVGWQCDVEQSRDGTARPGHTRPTSWRLCIAVRAYCTSQCLFASHHMMQVPLLAAPLIAAVSHRWNIAPSPGWTQAEIAVLRLCLLKHGVGRWMQIIDSGLLSGKLIQQLSGQTQRLVGQQSLAGATQGRTYLAQRSVVTCNLLTLCWAHCSVHEPASGCGPHQRRQ